MDTICRDAAIRRSFRSLSQIQWAVSATTLLLVVALIASSPIRIDATQISFKALIGVAFGAVALVYTYCRFDLKIAGLCDAVAQLCFFIMIGGAASYVATHYGAWSAFQDEAFLAIDRAFGLDWRAYLHFVSRHSFMVDAFDLTYRSLLWQILLLVVVLTAIARAQRLQTFVLAFQLSTLLCVAVSAILPAVGTYRHLGITAQDHPGVPLMVMDLPVAAILQLRGDAPVVPLGEFEGVVTFPSMHTTLAILFAWGFWRVPGLRWLALAFNVTMVLATPLWGSHYFVDVAGGAVVAALALSAATAVRRRVERASATRDTFKQTSPGDAVPIPALAA